VRTISQEQIAAVTTRAEWIFAAAVGLVGSMILGADVGWTLATYLVFYAFHHA
jgi:hypothetical protein